MGHTERKKERKAATGESRCRINNSIIASIVTSKRWGRKNDREVQYLFAGKFSTNACMATISKQMSNKFQQ